jgi:NAD(P)H-dependent FMN reductase
MARILLVWQSRSGRTAMLKDAIVEGIKRVPETQLRCLSASTANVDDVLWAEGYLFGCAEYFGSMAGLFKDFLERVYEPLQERVAGRPYALFVAAGNDGRGAASSIDRIVRGLSLKVVQDALIWRSNDVQFSQDAAVELGETFATALQLGLW